jgi:hypothetical protein
VDIVFEYMLINLTWKDIRKSIWNLDKSQMLISVCTFFFLILPTSKFLQIYKIGTGQNKLLYTVCPNAYKATVILFMAFNTADLKGW